MSLKITTNELAVMVGIYTSEYNSGDPSNPVWTSCIHGWSGSKAFSGVCSSLSRKGLIGSDADTIWLTSEGIAETEDRAAALANPAKAAKVKTETKRSIKAQAKVGKAALASMAASPALEVKPAKVVTESVLATERQHLLIEMALENFLSLSKGETFNRVQALLDMVRDTATIEFVVKV